MSIEISQMSYRDIVDEMYMVRGLMYKHRDDEITQKRLFHYYLELSNEIDKRNKLRKIKK